MLVGDVDKSIFFLIYPKTCFLEKKQTLLAFKKKSSWHCYDYAFVWDTGPILLYDFIEIIFLDDWNKAFQRIRLTSFLLVKVVWPVIGLICY